MMVDSAGGSASYERKVKRMLRSLQENGGVDLIFHTNLFSGKTMDLTVHPQETNMSFLDQVSGAWASIAGVSRIVADPATVRKYYSPALKAWLGDMGDGVHDGGPNDPRIGVIKLEAKLATHVVSRKGIMGRAVDTVKGVVKGDVPSINGIRELSQEELAECKLLIVPCSRSLLRGIDEISANCGYSGRQTHHK